MKKMDYKRQSGIFNPQNMNKEVCLIGAGSVGSFTALALSKMGVKLTKVYDNDTVEPHNIPNQFFRLTDIKKKKTSAIKTLIKDFSGADIKTSGLVTFNTAFSEEIIISAVDSMDARKIIWAQVKDSKPEFYIDSRMGGKVFSLFTVDMDNPQEIAQYEKSLVDDSVTAQIPCTEKTIIFNVLGLASFICNQISKICNKKNILNEIHFDYENYVVVKNDGRNTISKNKLFKLF